MMIFISKPEQVVELIRPNMNKESEELWALALNARGKLLSHKMLFRGTVDACPFYPRDIFRFIILQNASAFIIAHNHPSGCPLPSVTDLKLTKKLARLANLLEIPLLDHVIISEDSFWNYNKNKREQLHSSIIV